jgi:hypothetical protein
MKSCCWLIAGVILIASIGCGGSSSNGQHDNGPLSVTPHKMQDQAPDASIPDGVLWNWFQQPHVAQ